MAASSFRKDPDTRPLACFIDLSESGGSQSVHFSSQDLQKCKAIIDRMMTLMKIFCLPEQISELGAVSAVARRGRARPAISPNCNRIPGRCSRPAPRSGCRTETGRISPEAHLEYRPGISIPGVATQGLRGKGVSQEQASSVQRFNRWRDIEIFKSIHHTAALPNPKTLSFAPEFQRSTTYVILASLTSGRRVLLTEPPHNGCQHSRVKVRGVSRVPRRRAIAPVSRFRESWTTFKFLADGSADRD